MTGFAYPEILKAIRVAFASGDTARAAALNDRFLPYLVFEGQVRVGLGIRKEVLRRRGVLVEAVDRVIGDDVAPGEIEWWEKNNDPLDRYERYLLESNLTTKEKLEEIDAGVIREIDEDCAWAESSPLPEGEQAAYGVFDNNVVPPAFRPKVLEG